MTEPLIGLRAMLQGLARPADLPDWDALVTKVRVADFSAKSVIVHQGYPSSDVHFVLQGLVRLSYETAKGTFLTKSIIAAEAAFASVTALEGGPSTFTATAIERSKIASISYPALTALMDQHHAWERVVRKVFASLAAKKERREFELLTMSPQQRWLNFKADNPDLLTRLTQIEVAGLIGITPVALSRLKARIEGKSVGPKVLALAPVPTDSFASAAASR